MVVYSQGTMSMSKSAITTAGKFIFVYCKHRILLLIPFLLLFLSAFFFSPSDYSLTLQKCVSFAIRESCARFFFLDFDKKKSFFFRIYSLLYCHFRLFCLFPFGVFCFSFYCRWINFVFVLGFVRIRPSSALVLKNGMQGNENKLNSKKKKKYRLTNEWL